MVGLSMLSACSRQNVRSDLTFGSTAESHIQVKIPDKGEHALAGLVIQQVPEDPVEAENYRKNAHPSVVHHVFWDGRVRKIFYSPDGEELGDVWWSIEKGSEFWNLVDFSYGSDPLFKKNVDPRIMRQP